MMMGMVAMSAQASGPSVLTFNTAGAPFGVNFSNGNATVTMTQGYGQGCLANVAALSGKKCWTINYTGSANDISVGVATAAMNLNSQPGDETISVGYHTGGGAPGGIFQNGGTINFPYWGGATHTQTIIVGWDTATNTIEIFVDGSSIGTQVCTALGAAAYPAVGAYSSQAVTITRTVSPPSGYTAI